MLNNDDYMRKFSAMEQAATAMRPVATLMTTYFNALIDNGLTRPEALILTKAYQKIFINYSMRNNPQDKDDDSGDKS